MARPDDSLFVGIMPSLLDLPCELRACIIDLIIFDCRARSRLETVNEHRIELKDYEGGSAWSGEGVRYQTTPEAYRANTTGLLQANHQLHTETARQLSLHRSRAEFRLDVICNDDYTLSPTWVRLPTVTRSVETLSITFLILGEDDSAASPPDEFYPDGFGPVRLCHRMCNMLVRFFFRGASAPDGPSSRDYAQTETQAPRTLPTAVRTLIFNIEPISDTCNQRIQASSNWEPSSDLVDNTASRSSVRVSRFTRNLAKFAAFTRRWLSLMLALSKQRSWHGLVLYRNVETIKVYVEGESTEEFDLGQSLIGFPRDKPPGIFEGLRQPDFETWMTETIAIRTYRGFSVPDQIT